MIDKSVEALDGSRGRYVVLYATVSEDELFFVTSSPVRGVARPGLAWRGVVWRRRMRLGCASWYSTAAAMQCTCPPPVKH